jgi:hypothetical protein
MIHSERYKPKKKECCLKCAFNQGEHAKFCEFSKVQPSDSEPTRDRAPA